MDERHKARAWVEGNYPLAQGTIKALMILSYGAGLDAGLAEAEEIFRGALKELLGSGHAE